MTWIKRNLQCSKTNHRNVPFQASSGDPYYDSKKGMEFVIEQARKDLHSLQNGGLMLYVL
jgi:predicted TIM-barrel enzyme